VSPPSTGNDVAASAAADYICAPFTADDVRGRATADALHAAGLKQITVHIGFEIAFDE
jgi:hypothetical protein